MTSSLDLSSIIYASKTVPDHTSRDVFFHLAEEVGEVSVCINRPHKADESLAGEIADVINCAVDIYLLEYGEDLTELQRQINLKSEKWVRVSCKQ